jgi:16S rRNA (cytosine1402-N4)-methyltransferase
VRPGDQVPTELHVPVLADRVLELLAPPLRRAGSVVVDATVGLGGHSQALLERNPQARLVGLDRDRQALQLATKRLARFGERVTLIRARYDELPSVLKSLRLPQVDAVLFDLGVSSLQLDTAARGFSYAHDAPLDMRMDPTHGPTAADILNTYSVPELTRVLREYGEERYAGRIARAIAKERTREPFTSSARLVELLYAVIPAGSRRTGGHPAKRTFQALRIEVNGELTALERALPQAIDALSMGGRAAVLSYHSLEDRIVKRVFASAATSRTPQGLPMELPGHAATLRLLTRGAEKPSPAELAANPRATSARLRAVERIEVAA